jgi:hypothetical protein
MYQTHSTNVRVLLMAAGLLMLGLALVGPKSIWGLLGAIPFLSGLIVGRTLVQIVGGGALLGTSARRRAMSGPMRDRGS